MLSEAKSRLAGRKIIVQEFITLDGVMQAPGGPEEDKSSDFKFGGWTAPYFAEADEAAGDFMKRWMESTDILLGQKTFELFAGYWPKHADMWPGIIDVTKYVVSDTMSQSEVNKSGWKNSVLLKSVDDIKKLKNLPAGPLRFVEDEASRQGSESSAIKVHGSGNLAQTLFKYDLVDELCLMTFPITLGTGKRLFGEGTIPAAFTMTDSLITSNGVIFTYYKRAGEVKTGTIGA
ncbi:MAG: dihydrofolate reductase family protein [Bacteroidetes bacterium]|nr:dihydrofolate reductase family protein [Bacteroidota bacterium]